MKVTKLISTIVISILLLSATTITGQELNPVVKAKYKTIEANYLVGLKSDNEGLRISCAYYLGEMRSEKAVHELLKVLREDECYVARIVAALSVIKIGNTNADYMVQRTSLFDEYEGIRKMSEKFYLSQLMKKYLEQNPEKVAELSYLKF
jgi:HEAT repeat protein